MILSVIIPFHNEIDLVRRCVQSIFLQDLKVKKIEIIIINDGNFSETDILSKIDSFILPNVRIIKNRYTKGPGGARNTGLDACSGGLIAFLDVDDTWLPCKISYQLQEIAKGATFVATAYRFDVGTMMVRPPRIIKQPIDVFLQRGIGTSTVLISRKLISDTRFKDIRFAQDIDYWYALSKSNDFKYSSVSDCTVVYGTSGSTNNKLTQLRYFYKVLAINNIGPIKRMRIIFSYVYNGVYTHYLKRLFA